MNVPAKFVAHNEDRVRANAAQILKNYRAEVEPQVVSKNTFQLAPLANAKVQRIQNE